ncbi:hypothetical protein H5410_004736 [Solanum commersonii]|uniref:Uncharacterized protein n=1 Tax=Solanum commersonii TaxID=4109 RepID=A0A9J6A4F1_SOLCO|nr:hypothetical protein H5410_004736 [Solanum commersonii]
MIVILTFRSFWGIYVIFNHFRAVTKRSKVLFSYSSRYSMLRKEVKFCFVIRDVILRSLVQVKIFKRCFLYCLCVFLDFSAILGHLRNIRHFRVVTKRSIYVIFGHFWAMTKRSKKYFSYSSRYSKFIGGSQIFLMRFLYCLCVFLGFLAISGNLSNIRPFSSNYKNKPFWSIYVIFGHFRVVSKRSKVLFCYSSRYSKVICASQKKFHVFFFIVYVYFLIFGLFWGINIIFSHFQSVTKRSKVIGTSQFFLRCLLYYLCLFLDFLAILRRFMYFFNVFFFIFRPFWSINIIFGHFWVVTKRSKVLFSYLSRYSKVIGASRNFFELRKVVKLYSVILHDILRSLVQPFTKYSAIFEQLRKEVKFCSIIRHDILRSPSLVSEWPIDLEIAFCSIVLIPKWKDQVGDEMVRRVVSRSSTISPNDSKRKEAKG